MLSIHRCGYNWMYCDGDCLNCNYVTRTCTSNSTTGATPCTANCKYKSWNGYCSLNSGCPYRSFAIYPNPLVYSHTCVLEKKPIKVKARKVIKKRRIDDA